MFGPAHLKHTKLFIETKGIREDLISKPADKIFAAHASRFNKIKEIDEYFCKYL